MDIVLETPYVWELDFEFEPPGFLSAAASLLQEGDIVLFGAYEPTPILVAALTAIGATPHAHLPEFHTAFNYNRAEHPHGSAFEYRLGHLGLTPIVNLDRTILQQTDIPSFYDHFISYRPGNPRIPLISFHDAACGGLLYLSDSYHHVAVDAVARQLNGTCRRILNSAI